MKKLMMTMSVAVLSLCGTLSPAQAGDRVNLWPLLSVENGEVDFLWPLGNFKDGQNWRFFPIVRDYDTFAVFPELWINRHSFAVLPFWSTYDFDAGCLFPVLFWNAPSHFNSIFPLYWYDGNDSGDSTLFWAGCGLGGYKSREGKMLKSWLLPFYIAADDDFYSIPYSWSKTYKGHDEAYLCGLAGRSLSEKGETCAHWMFPFWFKDEDHLTTLPYCADWKGDGTLRSWFSIPLLSGAQSKSGTWRERYLLGMFGRNVNEQTHETEASWAIPFYYADDTRLITPVYGHADDARWGLPGWYCDTSSFVSPLWYHHLDKAGAIDRWMLPLLLSGGTYRDGEKRDGFLLNLAGRVKKDSGFSSSWCFPLYYADNEGTFVTALYGRKGDSQWCFPIWYNDERTFVSAAWYQKRDDRGELTDCGVPLLLSGYTSSNENNHHEFEGLLGLFGREWDDTYEMSWCFPFYGADSKGNFITPLAGRFDDAKWAVPLFYAEKETFVSLPYIRSRTDSNDGTSHLMLPFLSAYTAYDNGSDLTVAGLLYGHERGANGSAKRDWLFPLWYWDDEGIITGLYGTQRNRYHYWFTPLVGTYAGSKTGGWLFPLFNRKKDKDFDLLADTLEADVLSAELISTGKYFKTASITGSVLLGSDFDNSVTCEDDGKAIRLSQTVKRGNKLFFNHSSNRTVRFDRQTLRRSSEYNHDESMALGGILYNHEATSNTEHDRSESKTQILWKLWDREEKNGDVTLDAFPGITYDRRKDGYRKTSFLWRVFRYENDPKKGTSVDFLFLPIWR